MPIYEVVLSQWVRRETAVYVKADTTAEAKRAALEDGGDCWEFANERRPTQVLTVTKVK